MGLGYKNNINAAVTAVSNTFIDEYMGTASGEYVKVYLYLLRHEGENVEIPDIADALNHTEADVRRALAYWERAGVLAPEREFVEEQETAVTREMAEETENSGARFAENRQNAGSAPGRGEMNGQKSGAEVPMDEGASQDVPSMEKPAIPDAGNSYDRMKRLSSDEEFSALLSTRFSSISERHSARSNVRNLPTFTTCCTCHASFSNISRNTVLKAATRAFAT